MAFLTDRFLQRGATSRVMRAIVPGVAMLIGGVTLVTLSHWDAPALAVAAVSIGFASCPMGLPLMLSGVSELCPPRQTAGTMGVVTGCMAVGGLIAPYGAGVLIDHAATKVDGYSLVFLLAGIAAVVGAALVLAFANPERDKARIRGL